MILGIDPGLTGCVAVINGNKISFYDTPITKVKKGRKMKSEYLPSEMVQIFSKIGILSTPSISSFSLYNVHCFVEKVHSMPGQGSVSGFGFGFGFGLWIGILAALHIPYTLVTPQAWKKELMLGMADKDASRIRAQELFPQAVERLSRKMDIGRSDALLIAEYGRRSIWGKKRSNDGD
jgi:crossover junction endodeoxyribonuclease RuvC